MSKLEEQIKAFNKKSGEDIISIGIPTYKRDRIPFTSPRLNYYTYGGLPTGKIIEFFGEEHGGKTTTALDIIANYQQMGDGRKVLYVDAENTLDVEWAIKLGVDVSSIVLFKPTDHCAEEILQFILDAVKTGEVGLWVLDSIGVLVSKQEYEKTLEEKSYAGVSKPLTDFSKKAAMVCQRYNCTGIGINQLRDDLKAQWDGAYKTPGGRGWKHICSVRIQFSKGKYIDADGNELANKDDGAVGNIVKIHMVKNKTCPPDRRIGSFTLNYTTGIDYIRDLIDIAIKYNIIQKSGAWFSIINPETGEQVIKLQGQARVAEYLGNPDNEASLYMIEKFIDENIFLPVGEY